MTRYVKLPDDIDIEHLTWGEFYSTDRSWLVLRRDDLEIVEGVNVGEEYKLFYRDKDGNDIAPPQDIDGNLIVRYQRVQSEPEPPTPPPPEPPPPDPNEEIIDPPVAFASSWTNMTIRDAHSTSGNAVGYLSRGTARKCDRRYKTATLWWLRIAPGEEHEGNWIAERNAAGTTIYLEEVSVSAPPIGGNTRQLTGAMQLIERNDGTMGLTAGFEGVGLSMRYMTRLRYDYNKYLQWYADNGVTWLRTYVASDDADMTTCLNRTEVILNRCRDLGIKVILVMTDSLGLSGMNIAEDKTAPHNYHIVGDHKHLTAAWYYGRRYRGPYHTWLTALARRFKDHQALWWISLMNEPAIADVPPTAIAGGVTVYDAFVDWAQESSEIVYRESDGRLGSIVDCIDTQHFPMGSDPVAHARNFYNSLPYVQGVTGHIYLPEGAGNLMEFNREKEFRLNERPAANATKKVQLLTELGAHEGIGGREDAYREMMRRNDGVPIKLQWSICPFGDEAQVMDCDVYSLNRVRDGDGEFWDCWNAMRNTSNVMQVLPKGG